MAVLDDKKAAVAQALAEAKAAIAAKLADAEARIAEAEKKSVTDEDIAFFDQLEADLKGLV